MKILAINGSPKGKKSITYLMVEEFLKGAKNLGAKTEHILLSKMKINHCIGCFTCWTKTPGICIFDDDMKEILKKEKNCDILIFATPLYVDNVSGILKNYMDRCITSAIPFVEKDANGETVHILNRKSPKIVAISNCGFPEQSNFIVLKTLFKRIARNMHSEVIAEIYRGEGPLLAAEDMGLNKIIENYKMLLQKAGKEIVKNLKLSDATKKELEKPLIPYDSYIKAANKHWKKYYPKN
ncbi:MAG: flavodoxin family protein [Candidatus Thorarchaeota archaeon]